MTPIDSPQVLLSKFPEIIKRLLNNSHIILLSVNTAPGSANVKKWKYKNITGQLYYSNLWLNDI